MKITCKIVILTIIVLLTISFKHAEASNIENVRHYTEKDKTRIVIQLDQDTKYQTRYDKEHNLIISLVKGKINDLQKSFKVNDGLVDVVTLKEENGKASIIISLAKPAAFNVFPLESPHRIVVDTTIYENILAPEVISVEDIGTENLGSQTEKEPDQNGNQETNSEITQVVESNEEETAKAKSNLDADNSKKWSWFFGADYGIISAFFDVLILGIIIYMDIKVTSFQRINRVARKNRKPIKEKQEFANMIEQTENE